MNLLTHFRKSTILRFVLPGLVLLFSVSALFADGIASRYPNDVGIENDPAVILADGFESYTSPSQLTTLGPWDAAGRQENLRIATEPGNYVGGHKSLEMKLPISQTETLYRLRLTDYATEQADVAAWAKAWERLAQDDPYWHIRTEIAPQQFVTITRTTNPHVSFASRSPCAP